jgi:hypothetical protein
VEKEVPYSLRASGSNLGALAIIMNFSILVYREFFLRLAIGFYMLIFQPPVNFCSDENIQTIFGTKLEDFLNYRIDYNSISQTVEKVVKKIFFSAPKASKIGDRQVLVEPTMALLWRPLDVLLFRRPKIVYYIPRWRSS